MIAVSVCVCASVSVPGIVDVCSSTAAVTRAFCIVMVSCASVASAWTRAGESIMMMHAIRQGSFLLSIRSLYCYSWDKEKIARLGLFPCIKKIMVNLSFVSFEIKMDFG